MGGGGGGGGAAALYDNGDVTALWQLRHHRGTATAIMAVRPQTQHSSVTITMHYCDNSE